MTVNAVIVGSVSTRFNKLYLISSFPYSGNEAKRGVKICHNVFNSAENGIRKYLIEKSSVLILGSKIILLILPAISELQLESKKTNFINNATLAMKPFTIEKQ